MRRYYILWTFLVDDGRQIVFVDPSHRSLLTHHIDLCIDRPPVELLRGPREEATVEAHAEFGVGWPRSLSSLCTRRPDTEARLSPMECVINNNNPYLFKSYYCKRCTQPPVPLNAGRSMQEIVSSSSRNIPGYYRSSRQNMSPK